MDIRFAPISLDNWEEAAGLRVRPDQEFFVRSNLWSIAEARFYDFIECQAIHAGDQMVGFVMHGRLPETTTHLLGRFMIDHRQQGRGHGQAALAAFIEQVRREDPGATEIELSVEPENERAIALYTQAGFVATGDRRATEVVYRLPL